jgi:hypothetical protein
MHEQWLSRTNGVIFLSHVESLADHLAALKETQVKAHIPPRSAIPRGLRQFLKSVPLRWRDGRRKSPISATDIGRLPAFRSIAQDMHYDSFRTAVFAQCIERTLAQVTVSRDEIRSAILRFTYCYPRPLMRNRTQWDNT